MLAKKFHKMLAKKLNNILAKKFENILAKKSFPSLNCCISKSIFSWHTKQRVLLEGCSKLHSLSNPPSTPPPKKKNCKPCCCVIYVNVLTKRFLPSRIHNHNFLFVFVFVNQKKSKKRYAPKLIYKHVR